MAKNATSKPATKGMKVESVPIDSLTPDPANARRHNQRNLDAIKASLKRFGQQKPIVVDGDGIIRAGNGTWTAAKALGWSHIDVVRTELKGLEAAIFAIADNRTAELAEWDSHTVIKTIEGYIDDEAEVNRMLDDLMRDLPVDVTPDEDAGVTVGKAEIDEEQMELKPEEHYDYIVVLATNVNVWNRIVRLLDLPIVKSQRTHRRIGLGRAVNAEKLLQLIDK